ncbi:PaaI family thioesterase [Gorillibacterium massiliense]|uniref:PaaI family thioesterase n=1 Tax=Gorillibacterium massiliense TaxID=1280390 RepID=UPI0004AEEAE8|nr:PaaI family thioesterase [Gorillibacterium massiliense]
MERNELLDRIGALSERELRPVENVLRALDDMKVNKYPFFGNFLDIVKEESDDPDVFVCSMPIVPELLNPLRIVYGGVTAALADMAMAWMLEHREDMGRRARFVTIDMHVNYHNAGTGKRLIAKSRLVNVAREVLQVSCEIENDKGDLVVTSTGTFLHLVRRGQRQASGEDQ